MHERALSDEQGMSGAIQRAFLFSIETCLRADPYFNLWGNKC